MAVVEANNLDVDVDRMPSQAQIHDPVVVVEGTGNMLEVAAQALVDAGMVADLERMETGPADGGCLAVREHLACPSSILVLPSLSLFQ